jgi:putative methyltransferase (TIGR04325 family)
MSLTAQRVLPPILWNALRQASGRTLRFDGPYPDWSGALARCEGFESPEILQQVRAATLEVINGEAAFEQDGIAFRDAKEPGAALASLLLAAACDGGELSVLDFGGALGSHYLRWRPFLDAVPTLRWCVVEQPHFVSCGRELFGAKEAPVFVERIAAAAEYRPNAVLASSVLQYLSEPHAALSELLSLAPRVIVVDRTPFSLGDRDMILRQRVPASIYRASYPMWLFSWPEFARRLEAEYDLIGACVTDDTRIRHRAVRGEFRFAAWMRRDAK